MAKTEKDLQLTKANAEDLNKLTISKLQKMVDEAQHAPANDESKKRIEVIKNIIKIKQEDQIKRFGKLLSPALEEFLAENYPEIKNIYDCKYENNSQYVPFQEVFCDGKIDLLIEMLGIADDFALLLESSNMKFSFLNTENPKLIETIIEFHKDKKNQDIIRAHMVKVLCELSRSFHWLIQRPKFRSTYHYIMGLFNRYLEGVNLFETNHHNAFSLFTTNIYIEKLFLDKTSLAEYELLTEFFLKNINEKQLAKASNEMIDVAKTILKKMVDKLYSEIIRRTQANNSKLLKDNIIESYHYLQIQLIKKIYFSLPLEVAANTNLSTLFNYLNLLPHLNIKSFKEAFCLILETKEKDYSEIIWHCIITDNDMGIMLLLRYRKNTVSQYLINLFEEKIDRLKKLNKTKEYNIGRFNALTAENHNKEIIAEMQRHINTVIFIKAYIIEQLSDEHLKDIDSFLDNEIHKPSEIKNIKENSEKLKSDLDNSLFAHIHNDSAIGGTYLEGNQFSHTLSYLNKFLTESIAERWTIVGQKAEDRKEYLDCLNAIQQRIIPAIRIAHKIESLIPKTPKGLQTKSSKEIINETAIYLFKMLLEQNGNILFPGGWRGCNGKSGHAMLYEFRINNNELVFIVHNSGAGIQFHQKKAKTNATYYSSQLIFKAPFSAKHLSFYSEKLKSFIKKLVRPCIEPAYGKIAFNAKNIYQDNLLNNLGILGFIQVDALKEKEIIAWIKGQRSGTCSWKVINTFIKSFPNKGNHYYHHIHFEIKLFSLVEYCHDLTKKLPNDTIARQLHFATQNFARLITKLGVKSAFLSQERQISALKKLEEIQQILAEYKPALKGFAIDLPPYQSFQTQKQTSNDLSSFQDSFQPSFQDMSLKLPFRTLNTATQTADNIKPPLYVENTSWVPQPKISDSKTLAEQGSETPHKKIEKALIQANLTTPETEKQVLDLLFICLENYKNGYYATLVKEIDHFYLNRVKKPCLMNIKKSDLKKMMENIAYINAIYASACQKQESKCFAENAITLLGGLIFAKQILEAFFAETKSKLPILTIIQRFFNHLDFFRSPYFITVHPGKNALLAKYGEELNNLVPFLKNSKTNITNYIHLLIRENAAAYKNLLEHIKKDIKFKEQLQNFSKINIDTADPLEVATYYYLENRQKLKSDACFSDLEADLAFCIYFEQICHELQMYTNNKLDTLFSYRTPEKLLAEFPNKTEAMSCYSFIQRPDGIQVCMLWGFLNEYYLSRQIQDISKTQPSISNTLITKKLTEERSNSNAIQLEATQEKTVLSGSTALMRSLSMIRVDESVQVAATIDFMKKHFSKLNQKDIQTYCFINLFQKGFFDKQYACSSNIVNDLLLLLKNGFNLYMQKAHLKEPAFFFLKVAYSLRKTLFLLNVRLIEANTLFSEIDINLETLIQYLRNRPKTDYSTSVINQLYTYQLLNAQFDIQLIEEGTLSEEVYSKIFSAIIYKNNHENLFFRDPFIESQAREAVAYYFSRMAARTNLNKVLDKIIENFPIDISKDEKAFPGGFWVNHFPIYRLHKNKMDLDKDQQELLSIHLMTGQVTVKNRPIGMLPAAIYNHPLYMRFFKEKCQSAIVLQNQNSYEFTVADSKGKNKKYRFSLGTMGTDQSEAILQQEIETEKGKHWYQFTEEKVNILFPLFQQFGREIWYNDLGFLVIDTLTQEIVAQYDEKTKDFYKIVGSEKANIIRHEENQFLAQYAFITSIENPRFLQFVEATESEKKAGLLLTIYLSRYNISFEQRSTSAGSIFVWKEDPRYQIDVQYSHQIIPGFNAYLVLAPRNQSKFSDSIAKIGQKNLKVSSELDSIKLKPLVFIPEQEFIPKKRHEHPGDQEYYFYQFDLNNSTFTTRSILFIRYLDRELSDHRLNYYTNQENMLRLTLDGKNKLLPHSILDKCYLAYLFLIRRQPLLSFNILKELLAGQHILQVEELEWLRRILQEFPINFEDQTVTEAHITAAEFVAVRALITLILTKNKMQNTNLDFTAKFEKSLEQNMQLRPNARVIQKDYQLYIYKVTEAFYKNESLISIAIDLYGEYIMTLKNIPKNMQLSKSEELDILRFIQNTGQECNAIEKEAQAFLKQTHIQYRLHCLLAERRNLQFSKLNKLSLDTAKENRVFPQFYQRRLNQLSRAIARKPSFPCYTTQIIDVSVHLKCENPYLSLNRKEKMLLCKMSSGYEANLLKPSHLKMLPDEEDIFYSYLDFLSIAIDRENPERALLKTHVQGHLNLIAKEQYENPEQHYSNLDKLMISLYYPLTHPTSFPNVNSKLIFDDLESFFKVFMEIIEKLQSKERLIISIPIPVNDKGAFLKYIVENNMALAKKGIDWGITVNLSNARSNMIEESIESVADERGKLEDNLKTKISANHTSVVISPFSKLQDTLIATFEQNQKTFQNFKVAPLFENTSKLTKILSDGSQDESKEFLSEIELDYQEGVKQNRSLFNLDKTIKNFFESQQKNSLYTFVSELDGYLLAEKKYLKESKDYIINLINKLPVNTKARLQQTLEYLGFERVNMDSFNTIIRLFVANRTVLESIVNFDQQTLEKLQTKVIDFLIRSTHYQQVKALHKVLNMFLTATINRDALLNEISGIVKSKRCFNPSADPQSLAFEYLDKKILRELQYKYVQVLSAINHMNFESQTAQMSMGTGKTTVVLPLVATKKALGTNVVILEVPPALLMLNLADMNETTQKIYGKSAVPLLFNDSTVCSITYLKNTLYDLNSLALNDSQGYLMTTRESLQSLELKFLKILRFSDITNPKDVKTIRLLTQILNIIRNSDVLIDEVDSALDVRKELIYAIGKGAPVPEHEIKAILEFFEFTKQVDITDIVETKPTSMFDLVLEKCFISETQELKWSLVIRKLSESLVNHALSPLQDILKTLTKNSKLSEEIKQTLIQYLLEQTATIPIFLNELSCHQLDKLALYKEEIAHIFPLTLKRLANENFGLTKDPKKLGIEREIAIPYRANNAPNEGSHFGHYVETLNYTIRIQLLNPASLNIILNFLRDFIHRSDEASLTKSLETNLKIQREFQRLTGLELADLDIDNNEAMESFYHHVKNSEEIKFYCLEHYILKHVEKNANTLRSNAQNHLSQFRSKQGVTGTNWNFRCHFPHMTSNRDASLGSDGQTIDYLLKAPLTPILLPQLKHDAEKSIEYLFKTQLVPGKKSSLHAWIDLGAYFKGISNEAVAFLLAKFFKTLSKDSATGEAFAHLKYILYFSSEDNFYALKLDDLPNQLNAIRPISLKQTRKDYILSRLNCTEEAYFTYYDQVHDTGADIPQAETAEALVTVGSNTNKRDLLQAVARLRELKNLQRVIFVIPKELQDSNTHMQAIDWNVKTILKMSADKEIPRLTDDIYRSAVNAIENILRNDLLTRILSQRTASEQQHLLIKFDKVFFTQIGMTAFEQFGRIPKKMHTQTVFRKLKEETFSLWQTLLMNAHISISPLETKEFSNMIGNIIKEALPNCPPQVFEHDRNLADSEVNIEKEQQNEQERQQELESEYDQQFRNNVVATPIKKWNYINLLTFEPEANTSFGGVAIYTLNSMKKTAETPKETLNSWKFSEDIFVTENYMNSYEYQANKLDNYKKEGFLILYIQDVLKKTLKSVILTPEDAASFKEKITDPSQKLAETNTRYVWIETTHQVSLCGIKPNASVLHHHYSQYMTQIALINGDIDILQKTLTESETLWLKEASEAKLQFLKNHVLPVHKDKSNNTAFLCQLLTNNVVLNKTESNADNKAKPEKISPITTAFALSTLIPREQDRKQGKPHVAPYYGSGGGPATAH